MASKTKSKGGLTVKAYSGDAMTMLCFDLQKAKTTDCVGFTIRVETPSGRKFFLLNRLSFDKKLTTDSDLEDREEASTPTDKAPIQKFRWLHVPGSSFDGKEEMGEYTYTITPRYWKNDALLAPDVDLSVIISIQVQPFKKGKFALGFTRGFMISQAYARRFGNDSEIEPKDRELLFDVNEKSGVYPDDLPVVGGKPFTYKAQYEWMGWQAKDRLLEVLDEVIDNNKITVDVFAYDLDEPQICNRFLTLAKKGRIRIILDNSSGHKSTADEDSMEDLFEQEFESVRTGAATLIRCKFGRQAHQKTFILKKSKKPFKVVTGSTNLAVNGLYINANHVIVIENKKVADLYQKVFDLSFDHFSKTPVPEITELKKNQEFKKQFNFREAGLPAMKISFAPHTETDANTVMNDLNDALLNAKDSILFAVMAMDSDISGPVIPTLREMHKNDAIFSYGVTDKYDGVVVFKPDSKRGKMVSTQKLQRNLPKPFNKELSIGLKHKIHHKFVIIDFKSAKAKVYCGSSNLALLGEQQNNDNLLEINDTDIATAFAIEAIRLVDHFHFRASMVNATNSDPLMLKKSDIWLKDYYKEGHMKKIEREYFIE
ncbi:phospholipase D-like domain-containing protein [Pollutibacter soli]|uniref:phospholipase D-like domain-containing protein n=1 Tax=Pollutibacter soli TaxID=3034157 RepID=UPI003013AE35